VTEVNKVAKMCVAEQRIPIRRAIP